MSDKREEYTRKLKAKIDECDARLDKLSDKACQADDEAKTRYHLEMDELREERKEIEHKIQELQNAGDSAWDDLKQGIDNSWSTWKKSFSRAKSEFEQAYRKGRDK